MNAGSSSGRLIADGSHAFVEDQCGAGGTNPETAQSGWRISRDAWRRNGVNPSAGGSQSCRGWEMN